MDYKAWGTAFAAERKGSGGTRDRAAQTWRALGDFVRQKKWGSVTPATITAKQLRLFCEHRRAHIGARSLQNEASHIRRAVAGAGRELGNVRDKANGWSNSRLNVPTSTRIGNKAAMNLRQYQEGRQRLPSGVQQVADLQRFLGLRRTEAIQAGRSLKQWDSAVREGIERGTGAFLPVRDGTKGGRDRMTWIPADRLERVRAAVEQAQSVASRQGHLIEGSLEQAKSAYSRAMSKAGFTGSNSGHGLRRAFAQEQYQGYREAGIDHKTALVRVSQDLGHGDGRGQWAFNNYLRGGEG